MTAHTGYRNDPFCTDDTGGGLGERPLLHPTNRAWLSKTYGVTFVTVAELAERLAAAR